MFISVENGLTVHDLFQPIPRSPQIEEYIQYVYIQEPAGLPYRRQDCIEIIRAAHEEHAREIDGDIHTIHSEIAGKVDQTTHCRPNKPPFLLQLQDRH